MIITEICIILRRFDAMIIRVVHNKNTGVYTVTYENGKTKTFNKITKSIQEFYRQAELFGELLARLNKQ